MLLQAKRILRGGGSPENRTAGLKLPTEAMAFEEPMEKDTFSTCRGTQSTQDPTKVQVVRKSEQEKN